MGPGPQLVVLPARQRVRYREGGPWPYAPDRLPLPHPSPPYAAQIPVRVAPQNRDPLPPSIPGPHSAPQGLLSIPSKGLKGQGAGLPLAQQELPKVQSSRIWGAPCPGCGDAGGGKPELPTRRGAPGP